MSCQVAALSEAVANVQLSTQVSPRPRGQQPLGSLARMTNWLGLFVDALNEVADLAYGRYLGNLCGGRNAE